ncbi:PhzF family phenazine biosynthesis protein [Pseudaminobacter soli (ex Li et al. 2025)]|uniref:PhzF family phenazine biosynthesis protein n=1 Tax=Pseudaminobacter soli (ex Li et al. 2025) TaxID=1295366 RepID=A0A2P7SIP5_9HYPH|nr:PhzF family phenazine biosynthesis protein [Mesorhizobium soli]PSJ62354.1 PhzF family phenazine biosynthesis protein [Mesorhizobium soli]
MKLEMFQVDAFTDKVFSGNSAAVVLLDDWLPDAVLQGIALENNLAETAFLKPQGEQWEIRWFTPTEEVPFCGHATLASACALHQRKGIDRAMRFSTRQVGDLVVTPEGGSYRMDIPRFDPDFDIQADALINSMRMDAWLQTFRNRENFFAELASEAEVLAFRPDLPRIAELGSFGFCITARGETSDFVSRYFAPGAGIPEDPVTGSTHATLAPYWAQKLGKMHLSARQLSARGGTLACEVAAERVYLKGDAVIFMDAQIYVP